MRVVLIVVETVNAEAEADVDLKESSHACFDVEEEDDEEKVEEEEEEDDEAENEEEASCDGPRSADTTLASTEPRVDQLCSIAMMSQQFS